MLNKEQTTEPLSTPVPAAFSAEIVEARKEGKEELTEEIVEARKEGEEDWRHSLN